jgi:hypothetical protein
MSYRECWAVVRTSSSGSKKQGHHYGLAIYIKKKGILRQKEELWKFKIFQHDKNIVFKKNPL